jgi:AraC-like DNA-binding protein
MGDAQQPDIGDSSERAAGYRISVDFREPPAQFEGCFTSFYHLTLDIDEPGAKVVDYLHPEWSNIRFFCGGDLDAQVGSSRVHGPPFTATGPSALPCRFELGQTRLWGVGFLPLGWARFFDAEAAACANIVCDGAAHPAFRHFAGLTEVMCDPQTTPDEQFDALIAEMTRIMRPTRDDDRIRRVNTELVNGEHTTVEQLADASAMSTRTLERLCARYFGFPPKLLMRRQRFSRSLAAYMLQSERRWTGAIDADYHDQAQFTREFHTFMTMNPSEYAALDHPILSAFMAMRVRVWGSAAQTLDAPGKARP